MCPKPEICHFFYTSLPLSAELLPRQKYTLLRVRFSPALEQHMLTYGCVPIPPKSSSEQTPEKSNTNNSFS